MHAAGAGEFFTSRPSHLYGRVFEVVRLTSRLAAGRDSEPALWRRARAGDRRAFAAATERYRRELQVHCYRMLGSLDEAEDLVQETYLRAWHRRDSYEGRATLRAWLYGIATNACLDALDKRAVRNRLLPQAVEPAWDPHTAPPPASDLGWLDPYPDRLLDQIIDDQPELDETIVAHETIELAFLVTIQRLPPRQRAVLILRDLLGWSARETATTLGVTLVAANSALQRARETLKQHLPERRLDWERAAAAAAERELLERYVDAWHRADVGALVALLREDARLSMPPTTAWYDGREAIRTFLSGYPLAPTAPQHLHVLTAANRQPAFAVFTVDERGTRPLGVEVVRIEDGLIAEIEIFREPRLVERFAVAAPA
jgi:RNA polymerase sigma-70 factor (ECF subfamily)